MGIICNSCGKQISDTEASFCPYCGAAIPKCDWKCEKCLTINDDEAKFCKNCGSARGQEETHYVAESKPAGDWTRHKYFKQAAVGAVLLLATGFGSYYYFNNMNEGNYLKMYAEAHRVLNEANSVVVSNTQSGTVKAGDVDDLKKRLQNEKNEIDAEAKEFSSRKPFQGYTAQHEATTELLQKESSVLGTAIQILGSPLDENLDSALEESKDTVQQIKNLSGQISVPNTVMTLDDDITVLPTQLKAYVTEQRKQEEERKRIEAERQARLSELREFFNAMDEAIDRYNSAKTDLGSMMESSRNGGMIWADYFKVLDQAKDARTSVRYKVKDIKTPQGTEELKKDFLQVLDDSVRYCEVMKMGANLAFNHYYGSASQKKDEADRIDKEVQNEYASFIDQYERIKSDLLK